MTTINTRTRTLVGLCMLATLTASTFPATAAARNICKKTASKQKQAAFLDLKAELKTNLAICKNLTDNEENFDCILEAFEEYGEGVDLAKAQYRARLSLCDKVGGDAYDPKIDPAEFSKVIDNPFLPFPVGASWTYQSMTDEGLETIQIDVLPETRVILGVECTSVQDVVSMGGVPVEDTIDWYAQDEDGNVWYFGEISFNYEDGLVADIEGSWLSGVDGAKPGIVMLGDPIVGTTYRQEWLLNEAEDAATVMDDDATVVIPFGMFEHCIETADFLPPEPDAHENKFYAPGIGFIYETKEGDPETVELVSYSGL